MKIKGIDTTYSRQMLEDVAERQAESSEEKMQKALFSASRFKKLHKECTFLKILGQYTDRSKISLYDMSWFEQYVMMVNGNSLFAYGFKINNWAFPDAEIENNIKNIEDSLDIKISTKNKRNSDGLFELNQDVILKQITMDAEPPPDDGLIINNGHGVVEFGTQSFCKSVMTLLMNDFLLRVPYPIDGLPPSCWLFFNTRNYAAESQNKLFYERDTVASLH